MTCTKAELFWLSYLYLSFAYTEECHRQFYYELYKTFAEQDKLFWQLSKQISESPMWKKLNNA